MKRRIFRSTPNLDQLLAEDTGQQISILSKKLGAGSEGSVFLASLVRANQSPLFFAAKNRALRNMASEDTAEHERELHHVAARPRPQSHRQTGILPFLGTWNTSNTTNYQRIYHMMPLAEGILNQAVSRILVLKTTHKALYDCILSDFLMCMLNGLTQLAESEIVHNDLSTKNILLYKQRWVISDFGQAETYAEFSSPESRPRGSPLNIPPEILVQDKRFPLARDIWALGQIINELLERPATFHDTLPIGDIASHLQAKKTVYIQHRNEQRQVDNTMDDMMTTGRSPQVDHQPTLRERIGAQASTETCLLVLVTAMCDILPEKRPDLVTLKVACDHLQKLLPATLSKDNALAEFYNSIQNEKLVVIQTESSPDIDEMSGDIEVEVANLSINTSFRPSPSPTNAHQPSCQVITAHPSSQTQLGIS